VSFIFLKGLLTKYYRLVALSLTVIILYEGCYGIFFQKLMILFLEAFSWIDYRSGSFFIYKTPEYKKVIKYDWEKLDFDPVEDKFMQRFDENGNFVNIPVIEELEQLDPQFSYYTSSCP
jgi:hypothetical protein